MDKARTRMTGSYKKLRSQSTTASREAAAREATTNEAATKEVARPSNQSEPEEEREEEGEEEDVEQVEEVERDEVELDQIRVEEKVGPFPGGPTDTTVLLWYRNHVAHDLWSSKDRGTLRCIQHTAKLEAWTIENMPCRLKSRIKRANFMQLARFSFMTVNRVLISALVERWHPETNTFHLTVGEMTITLDDVKQLIGLAVVGAAVVAKTCTTSELVSLCSSALGIDAADVAEEMNRKGCKGKAVRLEWLRVRLSGIGNDASDDALDCAARGYILYLLGCTLFADKSGNMVPVRYLQLLMDLDKIPNYAWGAAALAYIYRQLGIASRKKVRQISGLLSLVEAWSYEHIKLERPILNPNWTVGRPLALRWQQPCTQPVLPESKLVLFREGLDDLRPEGVTWDPYIDIRELYPLPSNVFYTGCLFCFDVVEPYNPERVLWQLGYVQSIPPLPLVPADCSIRGTTAKGYTVHYLASSQTFERYRSHQLSPEDRGVEVLRPGDCVDGYIQWYHQISHPYLVNPCNRRGMRDVHYREADPEEWRQHRDKALALLEEAIALGENQDMRSLLRTQRLIRDELRFDHLTPGNSHLEESTNAESRPQKRKSKRKGD